MKTYSLSTFCPNSLSQNKNKNNSNLLPQKKKNQKTNQKTTNNKTNQKPNTNTKLDNLYLLLSYSMSRMVFYILPNVLSRCLHLCQPVQCSGLPYFPVVEMDVQLKLLCRARVGTVSGDTGRNAFPHSPQISSRAIFQNIMKVTKTYCLDEL